MPRNDLFVDMLLSQLLLESGHDWDVESAAWQFAAKYMSINVGYSLPFKVDTAEFIIKRLRYPFTGKNAPADLDLIY
jgi:hypothetical protein